ncbi:G-box-binding factor 1-like isoform X1 [Senna tora]|uniref:G-box-binding factor 1-like isoform X1 n=1 Tax=Senna tora TaxID=362788 RepID=A0A834W5U5_9FABA|nr:G-box-binding factor 1-like isoform X1 [Senna tora]
MGTEESNKSTKPCKVMVAQDEAPNKPLQPHWSTSIQGYHYSMSTATPIINSYPTGSYFYPYIWPNQAFRTPLQYDSLHDPSSLKNHPTVSGVSALTFSDKVQSISAVKNLDPMKVCEGNLQPRSSALKELGENGNELSISKNEQDRASWSAASGSKGSSDEGQDTTNLCSSRWLEFSDLVQRYPPLQVFPSSRKQQHKMMLANGKVVKNVARMENCNANNVNTNSALQQFAVNSTEPNLNAGTGFNVSGASPQPAKLEEDEIRKERKRQLNRESARRSRIRRQQECIELQKTMDALVMKNSLLKEKLLSLSDDCLKLNDENNSIEREVIKKYGSESIADLVAMKPDDSTC